MNKFVLDSSAILATINLEPGFEKVDAVLSESLVGTVNLAEVLTKLVEKGISTTEALDEFNRLGVRVVDFSLAHAQKAAEIRPLTRHLGLSLGDRACLALAIQTDATAVTADTKWTQLDFCKVEAIR